MAYCNRDFLVSYQGALNQTLMDSSNDGLGSGLSAES